MRGHIGPLPRQKVKWMKMKDQSHGGMTLTQNWVFSIFRLSTIVEISLRLILPSINTKDKTGVIWEDWWLKMNNRVWWAFVKVYGFRIYALLPSEFWKPVTRSSFDLCLALLFMFWIIQRHSAVVLLDSQSCKMFSVGLRGYRWSQSSGSTAIRGTTGRDHEHGNIKK